MFAGHLSASRSPYQASTRSSSSAPREPGGVRQPFNTFELIVRVGVGLGSSFVENILSQPFVVFRRQCQINSLSVRGHRTPFSVLPVAFNLQLNQGPSSLWKGIPSSLVTRGLDTVLDNALAEMLGSPTMLTRDSPNPRMFSHFILKGLSCAISTPFTISAFIDSVQTHKLKGKSGVLDCLHDGLSRLSSDLMGPHDNRRFTIWYLTMPSVIHRLSNYVMFNAFRSYIYSVVARRRGQRATRVAFDEYFPEVFAAFTSSLFAEAVLYPLGTVVYRLYVQGCRILVDNMDDGTSVVPVTTRYEGFLDCIHTIYAEEGIKGFYKGFGALILQYIVHMGLVHALSKFFNYIERHVKQNPQRSNSVVLTPAIGQLFVDRVGQMDLRNDVSSL